ncbi:MAG TPA: restriction endonuclease subunit S [Nitrospira sp.]|nr:restriction endonuclease subunit S [Nitrospira sp.]
MIADLKPYSAYKDSGVPWLGKVPSTWSLARNGGLFVQRNETGFVHLPILEVSLKTGVRVRNFDESGRKQVMSDRDKYKRARKGDLAYNMMRMWQGAIGMAPTDGLVSPAYVVTRPLRGVEPKFYLNLFRIDAYMGEVDKFSHGIVKDRNRLYWEDFKQMPSPVPPTDEQAAIVRFLDHADRRIKRYIRAKQKLIKLLEEQKQAIIHRAVTRGLDPNVRLKPSGVEWLGDVPEHWEVVRLKTLCSMKSGDSITAMSIEPVGKYPVYGGNGIRGYTSTYTHDGDFALVGRQGALCGNVHLASGRFWASEHAVVTTLRPSNDLKWFAALLRVMNLSQYSIAAAQPGLAVERILNLSVPAPPMSEQSRIAVHMDMTAVGLVAAIQRSGREIELLREYRTRLIADVVTGKLDVREAAAKLPDEPDEPESFDEVDVPVDDDEKAEGTDLDAVADEVEA